MIPTLPGRGPDLEVVDSSTGSTIRIAPDGAARIYVCGITPYDATHMGHAATYVTFDIVNRVLRDSGRSVVYTQNITDVDDPLLERAARDGIAWEDLAYREIQLFRDDMTALRVLPPAHYLGVVESIGVIEEGVRRLLDNGSAYRLPVEPDAAPAALEPGAADVYLDLTRREDFGRASGWSRDAMASVFAERGGDPERPGKRDPFDPLLWRAARVGEPSWSHPGLPAGRPGWHIECTAIALDTLGMGFDIQGGGTDLIFPHHEMSAVQADALTGEGRFASAYVHQAMVALHGEKMSKSKGNLVLVSKLRADGVDPMAVRLVLLSHHYASEWEWFDDDLSDAVRRLAHWREAVSAPTGPPAEGVLDVVRRSLADNLDAPAALRAVDAWADEAVSPRSGTQSAQSQTAEGPRLVRDLLDALLGVTL